MPPCRTSRPVHWLSISGSPKTTDRDTPRANFGGFVVCLVPGCSIFFYLPFLPYRRFSPDRILPDRLSARQDWAGMVRRLATGLCQFTHATHATSYAALTKLPCHANTPHRLFLLLALLCAGWSQAGLVRNCPGVPTQAFLQTGLPSSKQGIADRQTMHCLPS